MEKVGLKAESIGQKELSKAIRMDYGQHIRRGKHSVEKLNIFATVEDAALADLTFEETLNHVAEWYGGELLAEVNEWEIKRLYERQKNWASSMSGCKHND